MKAAVAFTTAKGIASTTSAFCLRNANLSRGNVYLQVGAEIPMDSEEADEENRKDGNTLLYVFERG